MCNLLSVYCYEVRKIWFVLVQRTKRYKFHFRLPSFMPSLTKSALYAESGALPLRTEFPEKMEFLGILKNS